MPIQIWTGAHSLHNPMVQQEMRQECNDKFWKSGLIVRVVKRDSAETSADTEEASLLLSFDVAYLLHPDDEEETLEQNIDSTRLRLLLSEMNNDPRIPQSVEEARLMLVGGEEEVVAASTLNKEEEEIDENTGFSKFQTVSIKRMTIAKEEETRQKLLIEQQHSMQLHDEETKRQLMERAKMEEAKYLGAEDSALGAYDVWGQGGYKGVMIQEDATSSAPSSTAGTKRFANTTINSNSQPVVGFKKRNIQKRNARVTSSED